LKKIVFTFACAMVVCGFGFAQDFDRAGELSWNMIRSVTGALPDVAVQQNIQPHAWIGYIYQNPRPEVALDSGQIRKAGPNYTFGLINLGAALVKTNAYNDLIDEMGIDQPHTDFLYLPMVSVDIRLGGIKTEKIDLPFDIGFSFFKLDIGTLFEEFIGLPTGIKLAWTNWGLDLRYLIFRQNGKIPDVSVGLGFSHLSALAGAANVNDENGPSINIEGSTNVFYISGQASYTLKFFVPYLGVKMMGGRNNTLADLNVGGGRRNAGIDDPFFNVQVFGGFGLDWLVFQTTFGVSFNTFTGVPGLNFTTRIRGF
jgi:hypothetical protein